MNNNIYRNLPGNYNLASKQNQIRGNNDYSKIIYFNLFKSFNR